jgi:hypothetical protein
MELKIVPPQDIKIRTVTAPTKASADDGRSAILHTQQALAPRAPGSPRGQAHDANQLGKFLSGEATCVHYPETMKLKDPAQKNEKSVQGASDEHHDQSRDSFKDWLKHYDDGGKRSERHSDVPIDGEDNCSQAAPGTYDHVSSIYDLYASFDET